MVAEEEISAQAARILRELPAHPAARRFCFAGWDRRDYLRLDAQLCRSGTPTLRRVLPDESILVGPAALPARLAPPDGEVRRSPPDTGGRGWARSGGRPNLNTHSAGGPNRECSGSGLPQGHRRCGP